MDLFQRWLANLTDTITLGQVLAAKDALVAFLAHLLTEHPVEAAIGSIVLLMAYCLIRAYCVAYVRAFAPSRRWLGGFPSSLDIRAVALGAMFRRATRVAVITEKPFGFESRWLHQLAALCLGNRIWFLHAGMDLSEVACHYRKAHVVVVGPFSDSKPSWVDRLCAPSGEVLRAHDSVHEVLPGAVLPPHPAYTD